MPLSRSQHLANLASHAVGFFVLLGFGLGSPVLPLLADDLGLSAASIGVVIGAFAVGRLLFGIASLLGMGGERSLLHPGWMIGGCLLAAAAAAWCAVAPDAAQLIAARALQGVGSAMAMLAASVRPFVGDDEEGIGRRVGDQQTAFLLGTAFGPAIGGVIGGAVGLHAPFWATALFALLGIPCGLIAHRLGGSRIAENASRNETPAPATRPARHLVGLTIGSATALVVVAVANGSRSAYRTTLFPIWGQDVLGMSEALIGVALSVGALGFLSFSLVGRLVDRLGSRPVVVVAGAILAASAALVIVVPAAWAAFVSMALATIGASSAIVASSTVLLSESGVAGRLRAVRNQRVMTDAGMFAGPMLIGVALGAWGYPGAFLSLVVTGTLIGVAAFSFPSLPPATIEERS